LDIVWSTTDEKYNRQEFTLMASFLQKVFDTLSVTNTAEAERRQRERVYLLQQLKSSSKRVLSNSSVGENAGRIKSSDPFAESLCNDILSCLLHGIKPSIKNGLWGIANKLCKRILAKQQQLQQNGTRNPNISKEEPFLDSVQAISLLDFVKTPEGKCRAWIRQALNIKAMADIISILLKDEPLISYSYENYSLLRCPKGSQLFVSLVAPLGIFDFCFDVDLALFDHQNFPSLPAEVFTMQSQETNLQSESKKLNNGNDISNNIKMSDAEQAIQHKLWQAHTSEQQDIQNDKNKNDTTTSTAFYNTMSMISRVAKSTALSLTKDATSALDMVIDGFASSKRLQQVCGFEVELSILLRSPFHCRYARLDPRLGMPRLVEQCLQSLENGKGLDTPDLFHVAPSEADVLAMKEAYGSGRKLPTSLFSCHATAGLLLSFLMSIPDNLIPPVHRLPLIMCATQIDDSSARNRNISFRLQELPWANQPILLHLTCFFRKLIEMDHSVNNRIDIEKISVLFAKVLFGAQYNNDGDQDNNEDNSNYDSNNRSRSNSTNSNVGDNENLNRRRSISEIINTSELHSEEEIKTARIILGGGEEIIRGLVQSQDSYKLQLKKKVDFLKIQYENQFKPFNNRNPQHVLYLRNIWQILFPLVILDNESIENHNEFSLFSGIWSRLGFRGSDPTIDLRGGGIFALEQLLYMCENYTENFVQCLKWQYDTSIRTPLDAYPLVITFIRVCRIANEIMKLHVVTDKNDLQGNNNGKRKNNNIGFSVKHISSGPCWQLLDKGEIAIGELCCLAFMVFHKNWKSEKSHFVDFENSLNKLQKHLNETIINKHPTNPSELWALTGKNVAQRKNTKRRSNSMSGENSRSRANSKVSVPDDETSLDIANKREPTLRANEPGSPLLMDSYIMEFEHVSNIVPHLPLQYKEYSWKCAYSLVRDGKSYATLYKKIKGHQGSLLIIKDSGGHIFGGFARQPWSMNNEGYYGTGETFVFTLEPSVCVYKWSEKNSLFMMLDDSAIAMGGGGSFAIYLDNNLYYGTSGSCETFNSPSLASSPASKSNDDKVKDSSKFVCVDLEIWVFDV
jgi:hypothetical protein